jgi:hypothetical protein
MGEPDVRHIVRGLAELYHAERRRPWRDKTPMRSSPAPQDGLSESDRPSSGEGVRLGSGGAESRSASVKAIARAGVPARS